jgi:dolichol kinase
MVFNPLSSDLAFVWDIIALIISFVAVMAVVQINSVIQKKRLLTTNVTRKIVHIFVAPVFIVTWPLYTGDWYSRYFAAVVPLMFVLLFAAIGTGKVKNEAFVTSMSRSGEAAELLKGTLYYALLVLIVTLVWFYVPSSGIAYATPVALIMMGCLAGGDGLADVIGRKFGKHKYSFWGSQKSIEGSIGMFLGSIIFSLALVMILGLEVTAWTLSIFLVPVILFAFCAMVIEALSPKNLDNWTVTIGIAIIMGIAYLTSPGFWPYPLF